MFLLFNCSSGTYEIQEADGVPIGTKIIVHLKADCREYADDETVKSMWFYQVFLSILIL